VGGQGVTAPFARPPVGLCPQRFERNRAEADLAASEVTRGRSRGILTAPDKRLYGKSTSVLSISLPASKARENSSIRLRE
jgi:hypothetical protein